MSGAQRWEFSVQGSESSVQSPTSRVQCPESSIQSPASRVQCPESSVQSPASRVQRPESSVQRPESSVQSPASIVQRPEFSVQSPWSRVQRPESSVQSLASRVQRPESNVQLLRLESRNSGMPTKCPFNTFYCLSWSMIILKINFQIFMFAKDLLLNLVSCLINSFIINDYYKNSKRRYSLSNCKKQTYVFSVFSKFNTLLSSPVSKRFFNQGITHTLRFFAS